MQVANKEAVIIIFREIDIELIDANAKSDIIKTTTFGADIDLISAWACMNIGTASCGLDNIITFSGVNMIISSAEDLVGMF